MRQRLRIPAWQIPALTVLVGLTPEQRIELLRAVSTAPPAVDIDDFGDRLAGSTSIDADSLSKILDFLVSLHSVRESFSAPTAEFVGALRQAIESLRIDALIPSDWASFEKSVVDLLSVEGGLTLTAKAISVSQEYQNLFCTARMLTDLRPIFGLNVQQEPSALVPVHTLKVTYHEGTATKDFFVSLDQANINDLIAILQRALTKEESLRKLTKEKGITLLEVTT
jgi:hypothetical protein